MNERKHDLIIGRFQPLHLGHFNVIKNMTNPVIAVIRGNKTSNDKNRNPIPEQYQEQLIRYVFPDVPIIMILGEGYIPSIINTAIEKGFAIQRVFAGADRINDYKRQVSQANERVLTNKSTFPLISVDFVVSDRFTSASTVRDVIRNNDIDTFRTLMPLELSEEYVFRRLRTLINT